MTFKGFWMTVYMFHIFAVFPVPSQIMQLINPKERRLKQECTVAPCWIPKMFSFSDTSQHWESRTRHPSHTLPQIITFNPDSNEALIRTDFFHIFVLRSYFWNYSIYLRSLKHLIEQPYNIFSPINKCKLHKIIIFRMRILLCCRNKAKTVQYMVLISQLKTITFQTAARSNLYEKT